MNCIGYVYRRQRARLRASMSRGALKSRPARQSRQTMPELRANSRRRDLYLAEEAHLRRIGVD